MEISLEMGEEEKFGHMVDWYRQARANMMSCGIKEDMIKKSIELSCIQMRWAICPPLQNQITEIRSMLWL